MMDKMESTPQPKSPGEPRRRKTGVSLPMSPVVVSPSPPELLQDISLTKRDQTANKKHKTVRIVANDKIHGHIARPQTVLGSTGTQQKQTEKSSLKKGADNQHAASLNGPFDAETEKSHRYLKGGHKAMKSAMLYQESVNNNNDVLQARNKLRQLQINYSKTNANLNDRVIMCDILKVTFHQVIPRIKLIHSLERRLHNLQVNRRRRVMAIGQTAPEVTKTIAELKREREERIKLKQRGQRKVDSLKEVTAEDIQDMKSCRYLRICDKEGI